MEKSRAPQNFIHAYIVIVDLVRRACAEGYTNALVSTRGLAVETGLSRLAAGRQVDALIERGWVHEVGARRERMARRLTIGGGNVATELGRAVAGDPEHPIHRATDPQVTHHVERTWAVRAWLAEVVDALEIRYPIRGDSARPADDPAAAERRADAERERAEEVAEGRAERARDLRTKALTRKVLGQVPEPTASTRERNRWATRVRDDLAARVPDDLRPSTRRRIVQAVSDALRIRGYTPGVIDRVAEGVVPDARASA